MNESSWQKWLRRGLCLVLIFSLLPVLLNTIAPAIAVVSVAMDPQPGNLLSTTAPWLLMGLLLSHLWFVFGVGTLAIASSWWRNFPAVLWHAAVAGFATMCVFVIFALATFTDGRAQLIRYAWPSLALSVLVLWLARRQHGYREATVP